MTSARTLVTVASVVAATAIGLTACGQVDHTSSAGDAAQVRKDGQSGSVTRASGGPSVSPVPTPSKTAGSTTVTISGSRLPVDVYQLRREGSMVVLDFGLRNDTESEPLSGGDTLRGSPFSRNGENDVSGVTLVDEQNEKRHEPARFGRNCLCTNNLDDIQVGPGQTLYMTASYAAPPKDVTTMDVSIGKLGTVKNVPIS